MNNELWYSSSTNNLINYWTLLFFSLSQWNRILAYSQKTQLTSALENMVDSENFSQYHWFLIKKITFDLVSYVSIQNCQFNLCTKLKYCIKHLQIKLFPSHVFKKNKTIINKKIPLPAKLAQHINKK